MSAPSPRPLVIPKGAPVVRAGVHQRRPSPPVAQAVAKPSALAVHGPRANNAHHQSTHSLPASAEHAVHGPRANNAHHLSTHSLPASAEHAVHGPKANHAHHLSTHSLP